MKKNLVNLLALIISFWTGKLVCQYLLEKKIFYIEEKADKNAKLIEIFYLWMKQKQRGKSISAFLEDKGFYKIAIYGMHFLGECLYNELKETNITILYGIDNNATKIATDINVVMPEGKLEKVDAIIVTPVSSFNEIKWKLSQKMTCSIISMEDMLENL